MQSKHRAAANLSEFDLSAILHKKHIQHLYVAEKWQFPSKNNHQTIDE